MRREAFLSQSDQIFTGPVGVSADKKKRITKVYTEKSKWNSTKHHKGAYKKAHGIHFLLMFARTKVDEFFHHKIKSIACLFDAYLFFTGLHSALVVFVTKSGLEETSVVLGRRASLVAPLEFLGDEREREVDLYTALFP